MCSIVRKCGIHNLTRNDYRLEHCFSDRLRYKDRTWFVVSCLATSDQHLETSTSNLVRNFTCETPTLRKKQDLECLSGYTNIYASLDDYCSLAPEDKEAVETAIAWNICEKPYENTLVYLKRFSAGSELIARIQDVIAKETV